MLLKYLLPIQVMSLKVMAQYNLKLPNFILELLQKSLSESRNSINEYIDSKFKNGSQAALAILAKESFDNPFKSLLSLNLQSSLNQQNIQSILQNGYFRNTQPLDIEVKTYQPLLTKVGLTLNGTEYMIESIDRLTDSLSKIVEKQISNSFDVSCEINYKRSSKNETEFITLKLDNQGFTYNDELVDEGSIDFNLMNSENELTTDVINNSFNKFDPEWKYITEDIWSQYQQWNKASTYFWQVRENSIEVMHFGLYKNIPVYWRDSVIASEFNHKHYLYPELLSTYRKNNSHINKIIFSYFLSHEKDIIEKLVMDEKIAIYAKDKLILTKLLLSENIRNVNFELDKKVLGNVLMDASIPQVHIMIPKISKELLDKMLEMKLIIRISNINLSLLSPKQMELFKDEQLQKEKNLEEFTMILGKIAASGVREARGLLSNKEKSQLGIKDREFKDWIDKNIGHSKGNLEEVSKEMLDKAKRMLAKTNDVMAYVKKQRTKK